jgi:rare lipoprotein A
MRSLLAAVVAAFALAGGASLPAEAFAGAGSHGIAVTHEPAALARLQPARVAIGEGAAARVRARSRTQSRVYRPRHVRPRHVRSLKGASVRFARRGVAARRHGRVVRGAATGHRSATRQGHFAVRSAQRTHRVTAPMARRVSLRPVETGAGATGVASFYGGRFHGRRTASGARFDANAMTAAHRSLPFGTHVRVTHLGNGRTVDVRITDRGPYVSRRIIDLSQGAAGVLGMRSQGVARVKVTVIGR